MSGAEWIEVVWLTEDDEGGVGVWRDPDNARRQIAQDRAAELPGVYEWVNDPDRTHELLLRDDEPTGLTLRMMLVADAGPGADPMAAEQQPDGAVAGEAAGRLAAFCDAWGAWGNAEVIECTLLGGIDRPLTLTDLDAVLAERTALTARVAELESERTEDARAVDAVAAAEDDELLDHAISNLIARFADRIEALDATETEES